MPDPNNRLMDCATGWCPPACESVFDRVVVNHMIKGPTRVMWELAVEFTDPGPLSFQLQVGRTANPDADDWADVGLPVVDQYIAFDPDQRVWGKTNWTHYRVILTTALGVYRSVPVSGMGALDRRSWRLARDIIRSRRVGYRFGPGGIPGYLLKRRVTGTPCPRCLDHITSEVRDPACPNCYGTGFACGYFYPQACVWAELSPRSRRTHIDGETRGTTDDITVQAEMIGTDLLGEDDVWVSGLTDDRYYVHKVQNVSEVRGVAVVCSVELRPIPFTSVIYTIPIPQMLQRVGVEG